MVPKDTLVVNMRPPPVAPPQSPVRLPLFLSVRGKVLINTEIAVCDGGDATSGLWPMPHNGT